jgi:hypothetical protein
MAWDRFALIPLPLAAAAIGFGEATFLPLLILIGSEAEI